MSGPGSFEVDENGILIDDGEDVDQQHGSGKF